MYWGPISQVLHANKEIGKLNHTSVTVRDFIGGAWPSIPIPMCFSISMPVTSMGFWKEAYFNAIFSQMSTMRIMCIIITYQLDLLVMHALLSIIYGYFILVINILDYLQ